MRDNKGATTLNAYFTETTVLHSNIRDSQARQKEKGKMKNEKKTDQFSFLHRKCYRARSSTTHMQPSIRINIHTPAARIHTHIDTFVRICNYPTENKIQMNEPTNVKGRRERKKHDT